MSFLCIYVMYIIRIWILHYPRNGATLLLFVVRNRYHKVIKKKWTTLNLSNSWHMYQKVSRENWLLYISPVNGISIIFASMEINYLTSLHCIISIYIYSFRRLPMTINNHMSRQCEFHYSGNKMLLVKT